MSKCRNGLAPGYLSDKFSIRSSIHDSEIHNMNELEIPIFKQNLGKVLLNFEQQSYGTI